LTFNYANALIVVGDTFFVGQVKSNILDSLWIQIIGAQIVEADIIAAADFTFVKRENISLRSFAKSVDVPLSSVKFITELFWK